MKHIEPRGRPKRRQLDILDSLRQQIADGVYSPGEQIPNRNSLGSELAVSSFTAHQALRELERQGFTESRGRLGTFVRRDPPHLTHFGIVFPFLHHTEVGIWSKFWSALIDEAQALERRLYDQPDESRRRRFSFFEGLDGHTDS